MHNLKEIRKDFNNFKKSLEKRSIEIDIPNLEKLDKKNRELIQKKEILENEKKEISKIKDKKLFSRSKEISAELDTINNIQKKIKMELDEILSEIPNIPHKDVPKGNDENDNVEISKSGDIPNFELTPFPDCKPITKSKIRYRCKDIGDWNLAQSLLNKGHSYLDRDKDGEACEALSRDSDKPEIGIVTIDNCYDGDTCTTTDGEKIRLACIDTPELRGKKADPVEAKRSRDYLNSLVLGKELDIRRVTKDRYGRTVAELYISDINIQRNLVENGYAKIYEKYSDPCPWAKN